MLNNWKEFMAASLKAFSNLGSANPEMVRAVGGLPAMGSKGALDAKTRELIALAVAATTRCDSCIAIHVAEAVKAGATRQELVEALTVAIGLNAGAAAIYSSHVLEAFDQQSE